MEKYVGSYEQVVDTIIEKIKKAECKTLKGNEICNIMYKKLNESITPMLTLKPFLTGAEKISNEDVGLGEILKFVTKKVNDNSHDLNFIINLCKEEHYDKLMKNNHPSPKATLKSLKKYFDEPDDNIIKSAIKKGLLDSIKSDLFESVKKDLAVNNLNESQQQQIIKENLSVYSPIGIKFEDIKNNRALFIVEYDVFLYDRTTQDFSSVDLAETDIQIPDEYKKLMYAINGLNFDSITNTFSPQMNWDFDLRLNINGNLTINGKELNREDLISLVMESINIYANDPAQYPNFDKIAYLADMDNFIMLMENYPKLIRFDNIKTIKNLNESSYITINTKALNNDLTIAPKIIASNKIKNKIFESYGNMVKDCNEILHNNITNLFESQLKNEYELTIKRNDQIVSLKESQKEINTGLTKVSNLKALADSDSPAIKKLNEQEELLNIQLDSNLKNLNYYLNDFKMY